MHRREEKPRRIPVRKAGHSTHCAAVTATLRPVPLSPQMPSGSLGALGSSGAAQARTLQPPPPPVPPLNPSQPGLRAQVPQFLSPQVRPAAAMWLSGGSPGVLCWVTHCGRESRLLAPVHLPSAGPGPEVLKPLLGGPTRPSSSENH